MLRGVSSINDLGTREGRGRVVEREGLQRGKKKLPGVMAMFISVSVGMVSLGIHTPNLN